MSAPLSRIVEGLRHIEQRFQPAALVRGKVVAREQEARFLIEAVIEARELIERNWDELENR